MKTRLPLFAIVFALFSCGTSADKPSQEKMEECLAGGFGNKVIVSAFDLQDGLSKEKDGVKFYDCFVNAELKFVADFGRFRAGEQYKIAKGTLTFIKTEKGWNCQNCDYSSSNLFQIKQLGSEAAPPSEKTVASPSRKYSRGEIPGRFPEASQRLITTADIAGLSKVDLSIMRNEIYARRGYIFKTDEMRNYFSEQDWYTPIYDDVENQLTSLEKSNVLFIKKYE